MSTGRLILSDEGLQEEVPPAPEPEEESEKEEDTLDMTDDDAVLSAIRQLNDDIDDEMMSQKIDASGRSPARSSPTRSRTPTGPAAAQLSELLPAHHPEDPQGLCRMEEQGVEGENIRSAKERIEGMMDKVVEGFEKQLDRLFQDDAMDIATDVQVLERMLERTAWAAPA